MSEAGETITSRNPATGDVVWTGRAADEKAVDAAVTAARGASESWATATLDDRIAPLKRFAALLTERKAALAEAISVETGKPRWDSLTEIAAMIGKVDISIEAYCRRCAAAEERVPDAVGATRFKPHGVVAVLGPFNFPGHVPNGHIVPALVAGNTVVFKPSEFAPRVAELTLDVWRDAGLPPGVLNLVQGARDTGVLLSKHPGIDGLYFTGSYEAGVALQRAFAERPGCILALELGGNSPIVVHEAGDHDAAAYWTIQSAFASSGQRCTCARRLILLGNKEGDAFLERLAQVTRGIRVGPYTADPEPFMGPLIHNAAAKQVLDAQRGLQQRGGRSLIECRQVGDCPAMLTPGIIDATSVTDRPDREIFGPLLQVIRVPDFDAAIAEANRTRFGLVAALLSDNRVLYETFYRKVRAGLINWNRPTTGASSRLPFGGAGDSGNHRPTGSYATDYCSYPVASLERFWLVLPDKLTPGITL